MYKCNKCGEVFEETGVYYNPCPYGERIVYEELSCCPACGSGRIEEIGEENDDEYDSEARDTTFHQRLSSIEKRTAEEEDMPCTDWRLNMAFNKVILMGNLTEDPELKTTPSGVPVTRFRIAVSRRFKKDGEQDADFINIVCWRATAEFVAKHFAKGKAILVCGQLKSRNWTDNDGNKRYALDVEADEVTFVDRKPDSQQSASQSSTPPPYASSSDLLAYTDDEECPF